MTSLTPRTDALEKRLEYSFRARQQAMSQRVTEVEKQQKFLQSEVTSLNTSVLMLLDDLKTAKQDHADTKKQQVAAQRHILELQSAHNKTRPPPPQLLVRQV